MRVLQVIKTSVGATWALRQMRELANLGVDVHATMPADGPLVSRYRDAGVTVHPGQYSLPMRQPQLWRVLFNEFRQLVAAVDPDIIHSHFVGTTLTMRLALGKRHETPRLFQVPGPLHLEHPVFRNGEIRTAGPPDSWIGSCRWTCDRYRRSGISRDRIFLSYYGSDLDEIHRREPGRLRAELRLDVASKIVGMVAFMYAPKRYLGQARGLKGHEDLIDAMEIVRRKRPDVHAVFVGGAWGGATGYERKVREYGISRLGNHAHFLGSRSDVPDLYADFDVVAHPSHSENVGGAAESQLLGVPTVATDVGGFPDLVIPDETGWLVPPMCPDRLAGALMAALDNPVQAHGFASAGQALARDLFDVKRTAADVYAIYERVLASSVRPSGSARARSHD